MGITRYSFRKNIVKKSKHLCVHKYSFKQQSKIRPARRYVSKFMNIEEILEEQLYELTTQVLHLKMYVKRLMYEYVDDVRDEIVGYLKMAVALYDKINTDYNNAMKYKSNIVLVDIDEHKYMYEMILDLCGVTSSEVYESIMDAGDGYSTPVKDEYEYPSDLCEIDINSIYADDDDDIDNIISNLTIN